jgi:dynactin complex subunit
MAENKHLKETLKQGDIGLMERETAIVERDKYIDQLESNLKKMHQEMMSKDMMLKQAQDHARVSNVKGLNPIGRYMG